MEGEERLEESTIAAPNTAGHVETDQHWVCHQPQDGERAPMVVMVAEFENGGREKKMEKKVRTGNKRVECFFKKEKGFAFFLFVLLVGFFTFLFVGFAFDFLLFVGFLLFCWFCFFTFLDHNLC